MQIKQTLIKTKNKLVDYAPEIIVGSFVGAATVLIIRAMRDDSIVIGETPDDENGFLVVTREALNMLKGGAEMLYTVEGENYALSKATDQ